MFLEIVLGIIVLTQVKSEFAFPPDFIFGVGSSSYQTEGAWNINGKGESNWDRRTHTYVNEVIDSSNADVACDSYHKLKEDVQLLRDLGVNAFRFSLSWPRILPEGFVNKVNSDGIRYYNELIDELLKYNITPVVSIFHWDLPYSFTLIGGWTNEALIDYYLDYARLVFKNFGDRVKIWTSFNEPQAICLLEYSDALWYLNLTNALAPYLCGHTILKAHAKVYHLYKTEFQAQKGMLGLAISGTYVIPRSNSTEDIDATLRYTEFEFTWFAHPIYSKQGDYSPYLKAYVAAQSQQENFSRSKLPEFTATEIQEIRGSYDYFGFNHYGNAFAYKSPKSNVKPSFANDIDAELDITHTWTNGDIKGRVDPAGFYKYLTYIKMQYNNPPVIITENGFHEPALQDTKRQKFLESYLQALSDSIRDGSNVKGYFVWSLLDNFEWLMGYTEKFGLFQIDFNNATRPRTARQSAFWYKNFIKRHKTSSTILV